MSAPSKADIAAVRTFLANLSRMDDETLAKIISPDTPAQMQQTSTSSSQSVLPLTTHLSQEGLPAPIHPQERSPASQHRWESSESYAWANAKQAMMSMDSVEADK